MHVILGMKGLSKYWMSVVADSGGTYPANWNAGIDSSDNIYTTGYAGKLVKYNSTGVIQWEKQITGSPQPNIYALYVDSSGNSYLYSTQNTTTVEFTKVDTTGAIVLQKKVTFTSGATVDIYGTYISTDSSGNIFLGGSLTVGTDQQAFLLKMDSTGANTLKITASSSSTSIDKFIASSADSSGNIFVGVSTNLSSGTSDTASCIIKYNSSGVSQWQKGLNRAAIADHITGIKTDSSGNVYIGGVSTYTSQTGITLTKYNTSGTILWRKILYGTSGQVTNGGQGNMVLDSSGNIYISSGGSATGFIAKYNSSGIIQWQRSITGLSNYQIFVSLDTTETILYLTLPFSGASTYYSLLAKLPTDGSMTGTYSISGTSISYQASSLTDATDVRDIVTPNLIGTTQAISVANSTFTIPTITTITSTVTSI